MSDTDEWEGWPEPGTRVRVPHLLSSLEGEVVSRSRIWITNRQVVNVRVHLPVSREPYVTRAIDVPFGREALEIISDQDQSGGPADAGNARRAPHPVDATPADGS